MNYPPGTPPAVLYQITARHFVVGFERRANIVAKAAPIIRYMEGWGLPQVENYCKSKRWTLERLPCRAAGSKL